MIYSDNGYRKIKCQAVKLALNPQIQVAFFGLYAQLFNDFGGLLGFCLGFDRLPGRLFGLFFGINWQTYRTAG